MQRKTLLIAMMTVMAGAAGFLLAGSAFGSDWYEYDGRLTAGNAYLLSVPAGADALEMSFIADGEGGTATVALFDGADKKVATWTFDGDDTFTYASPDEGDHVLFVYTLTDGGLSLRVAADDGEADYELKRLGLDRNDVHLASVDAPRAVDESFLAKADREPVFATLLYSGSAEGLTATVASDVGPVLEITGESGTSYGPGLYGDRTGERSITPENLAAGAYTADVTADRFEGDLFLTFVHYDRDVVDDTTGGAVDDAGEKTLEELKAVVLEPHQATAFNVEGPATLEIGLTSAYVQADEEGHHEDHHEYDYRYDWRGHYMPEAISLYGPNDQLVHVITFEGDAHVVTVDVAESGEYVAFMRGGSDRDPALVSVLGANTAPASRVLDLEVTTMSLGSTMTIVGTHEAEFELDRAPILIGYRYAHEDGGDVLTEAVFESEAGEAVRQSSLASWSGWGSGHCPYVDATFENLVSGTYAFRMDALASYGDLQAVIVNYDRLTEAAEEAPAEAETDDAEASGEEDAEASEEESDTESSDEEDAEASDEEDGEPEGDDEEDGFLKGTLRDILGLAG